MLNKILLAGAALGLAAVPGIANAQVYPGYGYGYAPAPTYSYPGYSYGYNAYPGYGYNGYNGYNAYPGYGAYGTYGTRYYGNNYYGSRSQYGYRCDNNTGAGVALGGIAGAVLGSSVASNGHRHYRYHRGGGSDRAAGALIGGVLGAVVGGAIGSSNC